MKRFSLLFCIFFLFASCGEENRPLQLSLKIIETTDTHGAVFPYDFLDEEPADGSLSQVYSYVKSVRESGIENILISGGDFLQGTPSVYYSNFESNKKNLFARVMNFMDYDVATVGNHDIEAGHEVYDAVARQMKFPWLAANAIEIETGEPYFEPYTIVTRQGYRIAFIGLITPHIPHWLPEKIYSGIEFTSMVETAVYWADYVIENENPDLVVGLFHAGTDFTYNGADVDDPLNENASLLVAQEVQGFDIVFVGHDHQGHNFTITNDFGEKVLIMGGTAHGEEIAVVDIHFFDNEIEYMEGNLIDATIYEPSTEFLKKFAKDFQEVSNYVIEPVCTLSEDLVSKDALFGDAPFTALIHRLQLEMTGADLSFTAPLKYDATVEAGTVTVADLFNLYKYENLLYTMELTGEEISNYLEYSYSKWFDTVESADDQLILFEKDESGEVDLSSGYAKTETRYYNYDSAAGIDYTVDISKPALSRVHITGFSDGRKFDLNETYTVAINSYRGNGGGNLLTEGAGIPEEELSSRVIDSTVRDLRYYLKDQLVQQGSISPEKMGNWTIIPEFLYESAKSNSSEMLFESH